MIQSVLSNLAIILLGHLLMNTLINYRDRFSAKIVYVLIIALFSSVIIAMFYLPIQYDGYNFDLRLIPLIFLSYFRGWKVSVPVLIIVSFYRLFMGGDGAVPGIIFGMVIPTLFALIFFKRGHAEREYLKIFLVVICCWIISDSPAIFIIPDGWQFFQETYLVRSLSLLSVAFIYYTFIQIGYTQVDLKKRLEFLAWHDPLTKLLNRNKLLEIITEKMEDKDKHHYLAMIDIDHFKRLNDQYGHLFGDYILERLASLFKTYEHEDIMFARYGGEEFIVFLSAQHKAEVMSIFESLQSDIRSTIFKVEDHQTSITVSIGLAKIEEDLEEAIKTADHYLYMAKAKGRDQVVTDETLD